MTDTGSIVIVLAGVLFATGLASLISRNHLIKMVMGLEFCGKGVSLLFLLGGFLARDTGVSQAVVFTLIIIEAVIAGVALALAILLRNAYGSLDFRKIVLLTGRGEP